MQKERKLPEDLLSEAGLSAGIEEAKMETMIGQMKNRLVELLYEAEGQINNDIPSPEQIADYLIAHGVIVQVQSNTPKTYFTPQEVRKMSGEEVRKNYKEILNSMKEWK